MRGTPFEHPDEVWLFNCGYVTEHAEQNLVLYGHLSCPGVAQVELMIDAEKRNIKYAVVLDKQAHRRYKRQRWLENKSGLLWKFILLLSLRRFGSYDPAVRIARCVKDYAGTSWGTSTEVVGVNEYLESVNKSGGKGWFFKDGIDDGTGVSRQDRAPASSTSGS